MFTTIIDTATTGQMTISAALICTFVSLILGLVIAVVYMAHSTYSKNFVITLALLPAMVQIVIMLVNGNLGTSVAVLGAFSLIRFRSVPGSSREISSIFFSMAVGLATGTGYVVFAAVITIVISLVMLILCRSPFGERKPLDKELRVTIPENLDYSEIFDDIFSTYTKKVSLERVKTTNLGSMYELSYHIVLKRDEDEKALIDAIRCRNGNLTVICGRPQTVSEAL